jgi:hypothetical protein
MLSTASRLNRWSDVRRVPRAIALPFVGLVVGLFLTTASASARTSGTNDAGASVESTPPIVRCPSGLLHPAAAVFDAQRRTSPIGSDLHAAFAQPFGLQVRGAIPVAPRHEVGRASGVARGYDATAPPVRFV